MNEPDTYREWAPPPAWWRTVVCCWEQQVGAERVQRVLPDGHADVIIVDSGRVEIVGLHDEVAFPVLPERTRLRGIWIRPAAVAAAFKTPASFLRNCSTPAEDLLGSKQARRLADLDGIDTWIRSIVPSRRASAAVDLLVTRTVEEAAARLGVTARQLHRILLADVGLSPKVYQQVVRLQHFVRAADAGVALWVASAVAGYADQPHLTREVRRFCGLTPAPLVLERRPTPSR